MKDITLDNITWWGITQIVVFIVCFLTWICIEIFDLSLPLSRKKSKNNDETRNKNE